MGWVIEIPAVDPVYVLALILALWVGWVLGDLVRWLWKNRRTK